MKARFFMPALFLMPLFLTALTAVNAKTLDAADCADYEFIFARGSGQKLNDTDFKNYKSAVENELKNEKISFHELDGYPAVEVDFETALGAVISAGNSYKFGESVEKGTKDLLNYLKSESKKCRGKKFILSGYSQGALVIDKALPNLNSDKILYVGNFGDPKLYLPEGKRACKNSAGLSPYRVYVPDCTVEEGILGKTKPYEPAGYSNKLGAWCNQNDFMCGSSFNFFNPLKGHTSYNSENGYGKFAKIVKEKITDIKNPSKETEAVYSNATSPRDIVVLFDYRQMSRVYERQNTKSIEDDLKDKLIALAAHGSRIAVYNYYAIANKDEVLEEKISFTTENLGEKIDKFNKENALADDYIFSIHSDNLYYGIEEISKNANWRAGAEKNIFVLVNQSNNNNYSINGDGVLDAIDAANQNGVKVSILSNNGHEKKFEYEYLAEHTGGSAIGRDYSKIILNQEKSTTLPLYFSKTFEINKASDYTLVIVNDMVYGLSKNQKITITNLDNSKENIIKFIGYDSAGKKVATKSYRIQISKSALKAPNSGQI